MNPFRKKHLDILFEALEDNSAPLDLLLSRHFKENKSLGSKDRKFIGETLYQMMRHKSLLDHFTKNEKNWKNRFDVFQSASLSELQEKVTPGYLKSSCPKELYDLWRKDYGEETALKLAHLSNEKAEITIRANTLKTSLESLLNVLSKDFEVTKASQAPHAIQFIKREPLFQHQTFKDGFFEMQDEASQLLSDLVEIKPGQKFLDYCSGSGGKTLAIAPKMNNQGVIYLHDIREGILRQAKKRLKRAGVQNAQIYPSGNKHLKGLKGNMDWVLVDAPCSGTGTLRRNPDLKWKFSLSMLDELIIKQREIFSKAVTFLKPGAQIVYATCSLLKKENEDQVEFILKNFPELKLVKTFHSIDFFKTMDGFFGAVFSMA